MLQSRRSESTMSDGRRREIVVEGKKCCHGDGNEDPLTHARGTFNQCYAEKYEFVLCAPVF